MGSSRPAWKFKLFNLKIKFNIYKETEITTWRHSCQPSIKRQVIMLPLHSQYTAAVK